MLLAASVSCGGSGSGEVVTSATNRNFRPLGVPIFATMFRRGLIHLVVACALVAPSAAAAQEPVQVDPDSPAGVEYKLPLEQARRDAGGSGGGGGSPGSGGGSAGPAPLFGAGISAAGSQSDGSGGAGATGGDGNRADGEQSRDGGGGEAVAGEGSTAGPGAGESAPSAGTTADEDGGGSTGLILGGIALAVVVVGGALGLALRRGLRITPAS
jgi:hypothetical protein